MKYREAELLATKQITTAHTEPVTLKGLDPITRLMAVIELTNNGNDPTNHPLAAMPKIEIMDGSDRISSMTGYGAQAVAYYDAGKMPHNELNYEDKSIARVFVPINFGRYLYDPELALDPAKFKNLQLRVTHDYSLGGSSPDDAYLRIFADCFDEKTVSPVGYLQSLQIYSFTPATGAAIPVDLPVNNKIRKIVVLNTNDNEEPDVQFELIKIDENKGKHIIVDCLTMDLIRRNSLVYGPFEECFVGRFPGTSADEFWFSACKDINVGMAVDTTAITVHYNWSGGRTRVFTATGVTSFGAIVSGRCPHGAVPILFGNQQDPDDWWELEHVDDARMTLTPRASAAIDTEKTTDTIVQSLQLY